MPVKTPNTDTCCFSLLIIRAAWAYVEADRKELGGSEGRGDRKGPKNLGRERNLGCLCLTKGRREQLGMQRSWQVWDVWLSEWLLDSLSLKQPSKSFAERARPGLAQVNLENLISAAAVAKDALPFLPATPGRLSIIPGKVGS